jgi:hypothetical protein
MLIVVVILLVLILLVMLAGPEDAIIMVWSFIAWTFKASVVVLGVVLLLVGIFFHY